MCTSNLSSLHTYTYVSIYYDQSVAIDVMSYLSNALSIWLHRYNSNVRLSCANARSHTLRIFIIHINYNISELNLIYCVCSFYSFSSFLIVNFLYREYTINIFVLFQVSLSARLFTIIRDKISPVNFFIFSIFTKSSYFEWDVFYQ